MKKFYTTLLFLGLINFALGQSKSTGTMTLGAGMTAEITLDNNTSVVTLTLVGPLNGWFALGFNATTMAGSPDCVIMRSATNLSDSQITSNFSAPTVDVASNNWTILSNTPGATTRTVIATRAFNSGDATDYTFTYALSSLNLIWAVGSTYDTMVRHTNRGSATGNFTTLGVADVASFDQLSIYPNPSNGIFTITKNNAIPIDKIRVFDTNARLTKEINSNTAAENTKVDLSQLAKGLYFMELSNKTDKTVKKIKIE
jgi:hypothetical protein